VAVVDAVINDPPIEIIDRLRPNGPAVLYGVEGPWLSRFSTGDSLVDDVAERVAQLRDERRYFRHWMLPYEHIHSNLP
jgi:hypothetical protein